jgi:hypothetical protein
MTVERTCACGCGRTFTVGSTRSTKIYSSYPCNERARRQRKKQAAPYTDAELLKAFTDSVDEIFGKPLLKWATKYLGVTDDGIDYRVAMQELIKRAEQADGQQ